ncbi:MAG: hypothetical protein A2289_24825 [Deltaproteobacteria bacterium RIFOXYA12_FULL_58_15]|nr:MAG: hypothetical protein A2289_24825 [Deltaproteobacteria bacterium RIFOXYA12_FULL_58_15]OGR14853.1 MAG: hypothetical protein A2341_18665 [Deltaproteobacteria bacterium RIFOXYB12_FULL_58_9]
MLAAFLFAVTVSVPAGLPETINELSKLVAQEKWDKAAEWVRLIETRVSERAALEVIDGQVLVKPPAGLGIYERAGGGVVRGDEVYLYAQVRNHQVRQLGEGFELHLVTDLIIYDADAENVEIARDSGYGESRFVARTPHRDTFVVIALRRKGLPSGAYVVRLVVHDRIGKNRGNIDIPFKIP